MIRASRHRRGFTMVELVTVITFLLLLASIGFTRYIDLTREAYATQVAGDIDAVRTAVLAYYGDFDRWPDTSNPGSPPPDLAQYLPGGRIFDRPRWQLAWVNFPTAPNPTLGILVQANDEQMMSKLRQRFGTRFPFVDLGSSLMFVMSTPEAGF